MIWVGIVLTIVGGAIFYRAQGLSGIPLIHALIALALIVNGYFLSFKVSPFMLKREKDGRSGSFCHLLGRKNHGQPCGFRYRLVGRVILLVVYLLGR